MAILKVYKCRECTRPLSMASIVNGIVTCNKCGTENKIEQEKPQVVNPLTFSKSMANEYIDVFKQQTEENPKDTNALYAMGLVYMGLKNYELAQRNFKMAVDQMPHEPDLYYYYALSLFEGHNPKHIDPKVADRIEEWLHTASNRVEKRKYLTLLMVLRQCAYVSNGLQFKGESPLELMDKIHSMPAEQDDVTEIKEHVKIADNQALQWLDEIQRGERKQESEDERVDRYWQGQYEYTGLWPTNRAKSDASLSNPDDLDYSIGRLIDENVRQEFFDYMYNPEKPERLSKPFYPIGYLLKHLILGPVIALVMFVIIGIANFGLVEQKAPSRETVAEQFKRKYEKTDDTKNNKKNKKDQPKKLTPAEKKEKMEQLFNDSVEAAQKDSAYWANTYVWYYEIEGEVDSTGAKGESEKLYFKTPTDEQMAKLVESGGFDKSWKSIVAVLLVLLPIVIALVKIIVEIIETKRDRDYTDKENLRRSNEYTHALHMFNEERPSIEDYISFCKHYLGKESPILPYTGDPVSKALADNHIDELDMRGKILFVNYFTDRDANGEFSEYPDDILKKLYYVIAIPQTDKLTLLYNSWNTLSNTITTCEAENVYYKNILGVTRRADEILIEKVGGTVSSIVLPPEGVNSVCTYQNDFPEYITYSNTRTSDPQVFLDALNALVASSR